MMKVRFQLPSRMLALLCGLFLTVGAFAQQITVKGLVKDSTGEPVIGATISDSNGKALAVSDFDGNFEVKANSGETLVVSYIGFVNQQVTAAPSVIVTMQDDAKQLEQVVVIGYGRAKKEDLTGSVTAMKPDDLSKGITNNASDMLVGKIAGVDVQVAAGNPGAGAQIRIRGGASLTASNDPLYVVDGLVIDNNTAKGMSNILAMINPTDIETFTVLKDASATAIYGSRASNGVIIITTKKGRAGQKPTFTYTGDITLSMVQKKYDMLTASEYRNLINNMTNADGTPAFSDSQKAGLGNYDTDWQDEIFRKAVSTNHSLSISGGLKNMPYRVSMGYQIGNGIIKTSWMRRFNASINLAPSFLDEHLQFNITAKYMYEKDRYADGGGAVGAAVSMDPTQPVYGSGSQYDYTGGWYQTLMANPGFSDPNWAYTTNSNSTQNPLALLETRKMIANASDFSGNVEVDYKIHGLEDLHIHASLGAQYTSTNQSDWISPYSYSNNYYGWDGMDYYWKYNIVGNAYLQYTKELGAHYIDVMAGAEQSHYHRSGYNEGQGTDRVTGAAYSPSLRSEKEWATHNSLVSYFGRLNYTLLDRYMLTATFRADGSSRFSEGNRWGYFPSVALAWKINNEKFLRDVSWLDELKLRAGWGMTGQQNGIDDFYYAPLYRVGNSYAQYPFGDTYYYTTRPNRYNPDLTWEKTTTWNAGLDFSALSGRFTANLDAYYRKTTDLLATVSIASGMNFGDELLQNVGSMENYGVELAFTVRPIVTKDFSWDISYNVGWNHNEITELTAGASDWVWCGNSISSGNNTRIQRNKVGEAMNSFYVYQQVYDENGKPIEGLYVDRNGDGQINDNDRYYYKSPTPDIIMGLTMKFLWKNWDFSTSFRASFGNYVYYDFLANRSAVSPSGLLRENFNNTTWEAVNLGFTGTTITPNYLSDYWVRNASFLKCTNITLGYSFPALLTYAGEKYFSGRVYFTVQNPFIISDYDGLDPEVTSGIDGSAYPRPMSFQLGVNFNF